MESLAKPSRTARIKDKREKRLDVQKKERDNKAEARKRDGYRCRFPLCGCGKLKLRLEASHGGHKGMGGDPSGIRSDVKNLITLCTHRHRDGVFSVHHGTMRAVPMYPEDGYNGLVRWEILMRVASARTGIVDAWVAVAYEREIGQVNATAQHIELLRELAEMEE